VGTGATFVPRGRGIAERTSAADTSMGWWVGTAAARVCVANACGYGGYGRLGSWWCGVRVSGVDGAWTWTRALPEQLEPSDSSDGRDGTETGFMHVKYCIVAGARWYGAGCATVRAASAEGRACAEGAVFNMR
jgi:hypothetical protein